MATCAVSDILVADGDKQFRLGYLGCLYFGCCNHYDGISQSNADHLMQLYIKWCLLVTLKTLKTHSDGKQPGNTKYILHKAVL